MCVCVCVCVCVCEYIYVYYDDLKLTQDNVNYSFLNITNI